MNDMNEEKLDALEQYLNDWFQNAVNNEDASIKKHYKWFSGVLELIHEYRKTL